MNITQYKQIHIYDYVYIDIQIYELKYICEVLNVFSIHLYV